MTAERVLIVEDDPATRDLLIALLQDDGYQVIAVADGSAAVEEARRFRPHLVLLDHGLPGMDGRAVARRLRERDDVAIIFVTAADRPEQRRGGLRDGGDDYVTKPFDPEELSLRIGNVLRRRSGRGRSLEIDDLVIDPNAHKVSRGGHGIDLTAIEFAILLTLVRNRGGIVAKRDLMSEVWSYAPDRHIVDVHMSSLRHKLEAHGPRLIRTVRGVGYGVEL